MTLGTGFGGSTESGLLAQWELSHLDHGTSRPGPIAGEVRTGRV